MEIIKEVNNIYFQSFTGNTLFRICKKTGKILKDTSREGVVVKKHPDCREVVKKKTLYSVSGLIFKSQDPKVLYFFMDELVDLVFLNQFKIIKRHDLLSEIISQDLELDIEVLRRRKDYDDLNNLFEKIESEVILKDINQTKEKLLTLCALKRNLNEFKTQHQVSKNAILSNIGSTIHKLIDEMNKNQIVTLK